MRWEAYTRQSVAWGRRRIAKALVAECLLAKGCHILASHLASGEGKVDVVARPAQASILVQFKACRKLDYA